MYRVPFCLACLPLSVVFFAACSSDSADTASGSGSFVDECDGKYYCTVDLDLLSYQPGLNVIALAPDPIRPGSCSIGSDVANLVSSEEADFDPGGTVSLYGKQIGTWSASGMAVTVCMGGVCTDCTDGQGGYVGDPTSGCYATLGCDKDLPWINVDLDPQILVSQTSEGSCAFSTGEGSFDVTTDGKLVAEGFPVGTWSGSASSTQICIYGDCTTCTR